MRRSASSVLGLLLLQHLKRGKFGYNRFPPDDPFGEQSLLDMDGFLNTQAEEVANKIENVLRKGPLNASVVPEVRFMQAMRVAEKTTEISNDSANLTSSTPSGDCDGENESGTPTPQVADEDDEDAFPLCHRPVLAESKPPPLVEGELNDPLHWSTDEIVEWLKEFAEEGAMDTSMAEAFALAKVTGHMLLHRVVPPDLFKLMRRWFIQQRVGKEIKRLDFVVKPELLQATILACFPYGH